ncbi:MAG: diaminopimelate epimerase [Sedimenticolaceae bacterium]
MKFTKMHGLGNDYVYVNCFEEHLDDPAPIAVAVSDRHRGIGADGLILICPSDTADALMRVFNADGSEAEMCGNGIRCVAKYVYDHGLATAGEEFSVPGQGRFPASLQIETARGVLTLGLEIESDDKVQRVCVNMGRPILRPPDIPVALQDESVINESIDVAGRQLLMTCVSMGNPHAVFFCDDLNEIEIGKVGPLVEHHDLFPDRVNAHFVKVAGPAEFTMRTWERGSGITMACGTGACACTVAGVLTGRCERQVRARLPGGDLDLNWCEEDDCVYMTGPAVEVFTGHWPNTP